MELQCPLLICLLLLLMLLLRLPACMSQATRLPQQRLLLLCFTRSRSSRHAASVFKAGQPQAGQRARDGRQAR